MRERRGGAERARQALKPLKQSPLLNTDEKSLRADLDGIGLQLIAFAVRVAAIAEMELKLMNGADDMAGAIDITVCHGGPGMWAGMGKPIPPAIESCNAELFTVGFHFGYTTGSPLNICFLLCEFIPLDLL